MAHHVFKTKKGSTEDVEVAGAGLAGADGKGGIPLERAVLHMSELQDKNGKPLTGQTLLAAARKWAERHALTVVQVAEEKVERLAEELGQPATPAEHEVPESPPAASTANKEN